MGLVLYLYMKQATINKELNQIEIKWVEYDRTEWSNILHYIQDNITGRFFNKKRKAWIATVTDENIKALREGGFVIFGDVETLPQVDPSIHWKDIEIDLSLFPD